MTLIAGMAFADDSVRAELLNQAYDFAREGDDARAEELLRQSFREKAPHFDARMLAGQIAERKRDWNSVVVHMDAALDEKHGDALAHAMRGYARKHLGKREEALLDFKAALSANTLTPGQKSNIEAALTLLSGESSVQKEPLRATVGKTIRMAHEAVSFEQSERLWRMAVMANEEGDGIRALELGRQSAALLPDSPVRNADVAYLLLSRGHDREAVVYFEKALERNPLLALNDNLLLDTAYAYGRQGQNDELRHYLEKTIEVSPGRFPGASSEEKARLFYARRAYSDLTRTFGLRTGMQYHRTNGEYFWQGIQEIYWQPYYVHGRLVQIFGQFFGVPSATQPSLVGHSNAANLGVRLVPFSGYNLVLTLEHLFKMGKNMRDEPRLRIGYSWDDGLDWNPVRAHWKYVSLFSEFVWSIKYNETIFNAEFRYGRSFKLSFADPFLVVSPHVFFYTDSYSEALDREDKRRNFIGPGLHLRKWYRQDQYNAPQSYFDIVLHYRICLANKRDNALVLGFYNSF